MNKYFKLILITKLLLLTACGFKVVDQSEIMNFDIGNIEITGNKRINYKLKNKLLFNSKANEKKLINISLNTSKTKQVKEKNIKNEITKYEITISVNITIESVSKNDKSNFTISKVGNYNVNKQHSKTLTNEKKLIELLTDEIAEEILSELKTRINDL